MNKISCWLCAILCLVLMATNANAASPTEAFQAAMSSDDALAKKQAIQGLSGEDDVVLPMLVGAIGDRQARQYAIDALRARTGLKPSPQKGAGGYPGYPDGDDAGAWNSWIAARKAAKSTEKKVKDLEDKLDKAQKEKDAEAAEAEKKRKGEGTEATDGKTPDAGADPAATPVAEPVPAPSDLGKLDRIVFKNGGLLMCYIVNKYTDSNGVLTSVRVIHPDQGGEEVLSFDLIARIEEDVQ